MDVGCLTELYAERDGPLLLFEQVQGCLDSVRLASNVILNHRRFALALGFPTDAHPLALVSLVRERLRALQAFPPLEVPTGPVLTHSLPGHAVDIREYPAPVWHSRDGGRYIGTGDLVVVRDPDTGQHEFRHVSRHDSGPRPRESLDHQQEGRAHHRGEILEPRRVLSCCDRAGV